MKHIIGILLTISGAAWVGWNNGYNNGLQASPEYVSLQRDRDAVAEAEMQQIIADIQDADACNRIFEIVQGEMEAGYLLETEARDTGPSLD